MKKTIIFIAISVLLVSSCQKADNISTDSEDIIIATITDVSSRAYLGADDQFYWSPGDALSVFNSPTQSKYLLVDTASCRIGSFERVKNKLEPQYNTDYVTTYAIYPHDAGITSVTYADSAATFNVKVKSTQTYVPNSFGSDAVMAAANGVRGNPNFNFYSVVGYLQFSITGNTTISSLKLKGNDGELISGNAILSIPASLSVEPYLTMSEGASTEIVMDCADTVHLSDTAKTFIFSLPPTDFNEGVMLEIVDTSGKKVTKSTDVHFSVTKNTITCVKEFSLNKINKIDEQTGSEQKAVMKEFFVTVDGTKYAARDLTGSNITVVIPYQTDPTVLKTLKPEFVYDGENVYCDTTEQKSGETTHDFSQCKEVGYTVVGKDTAVYKVRIIDSKNPVVYITTPRHDAIVDRENWHDSTNIVIVKPDGTIDLNEEMASIRGRGNNSWVTAPNKKPYALKFSKKTNVLGMKKHKRWCLLNEALGDIMFNEFGFEMARAVTTGLDWTPHGKGVEVVLNGDYRGYYFLTEQIRIDKNRVDITEIDPSLPVTSAPTGGYLFEFTKVDAKYYTGVIQWKLNNKGVSLGFPFDIHNPDVDDFSSVDYKKFGTYLKNYLNNLERTLVSADSLNNRAYEKYIDVDSFIDTWFIFEIIGLSDPLAPRSVWMYKDVDGGKRDGKLVSGPLWDLVGGLYCASNPRAGFVCDKALYYPYLLQAPTFRDSVKSRWTNTTYKRLTTTTFIDDTLNSLVDEIGHAVDNNNYRWQGEHKVRSAQSRADHIRNNITNRLDNLNDAINEL